MTTMKSVVSSRTIEIRRSPVEPDVAVLAIDSGADGPNFMDSIPRSEFLAAVAAELDAVIIPREELPTPDVHEDRGDLAKVGHLTASRNGWPSRATELRERGLDYLAAAEWVTKGVVEAQVEAIAVALADARRDTDGRNETWFYEEARRLYAAGVRVGGDDK